MSFLLGNHNNSKQYFFFFNHYVKELKFGSCVCSQKLRSNRQVMGNGHTVLSTFEYV